MKPNHVKNSDFMSILYSKPLREYKKPKFGIGDIVRISKYDLPFRKGYKPQFTPEILYFFYFVFTPVKLLPLLIKNLQHIQSKTNKKKIYVRNSTRKN